MSRRTKDQQTELLLSIIVDKMKQTDGMYDAYPKGYNQKMADTNNRLYAEFMRLMFKDAYGVILEGAQISLVDSGVAIMMSRAFFCARSKLVRHRGSQIDMGDAFESIRGLVDEWRSILDNMDPGLPEKRGPRGDYAEHPVG